MARSAQDERRGHAPKGKGSVMDKKPGASRRDVLRAGALAAPAAIATAATGTQADAAAPDPTVERMQDTAHTRAYYDAARF